ncbi:MAG: hypothetical protein H6765_10490 [Candidatus Peribacteria bacterium]|nr:MAG: hypothetical protein H6765_10490 [Candidatus Peribacteria bacterium]
MCGPDNGRKIYDFDNGGDSFGSGATGLCDQGTPSSVVFNSGAHTWTWFCDGEYGGSKSPTCTATETYCGDGERQYADGEGCDDGNDIDDDACSNLCVEYMQKSVVQSGAYLLYQIETYVAEGETGVRFSDMLVTGNIASIIPGSVVVAG